MTKTSLRFMFVALLVLVTTNACNPVGPSPQLTENFDGVLKPGGTATKTFAVNCSGARSSCEYSVNLKTLSPDNVPVQLVLADANCQQVLSSILTIVGQVGLSGTGMSTGTYCIAVIDSGYLVRSENFSVSFTHPK